MKDLTKREYFALKAMQGILANLNYEAPRRARVKGIVKDSLWFADALLGELEKQKEIKEACDE